MESIDHRLVDLLGPSAGTLPDKLAIVLTEASAARVVGTMPVKDNTQPYGLLHGGASCALAETLGSVGAMLHVLDTGGGMAMGTEISATHHRGARTGLVTGVATPLHLGTSMATYDIAITDEDGRRVCTARLSCFLRRT